MLINPSSADYSGKLNLSQLKNLSEATIWELYPKSNGTEQALLIKELGYRKLINGKATVNDIMTNPELFLKFITKKEEEQSEIGNSLKVSTFIDDSLGLFSAFNFNFQKKGTRLVKNGTLRKLKIMAKEDDRLGFDDFFNSRARNGTSTIYTTNNLETYLDMELYSPSTLDLLIVEEAEKAEALAEIQNLENAIDKKLLETHRIGLFEAIELENDLVKAGNKYPKKMKKVVKNDVKNLFGDV